MKLLDELKNRGILNDVTNEDKFSKLENEKASVYIGFDPTATSLHLGNYIQIAILKKFKEFGLKPFAVLGGATGMIGDPSGKAEERVLLSNKELIKNKNKIKVQLEKFGFQVIDNLQFYSEMNIIDFFREVGKYINVNYMMAKDSVKSRLDKGISFTEFSYQLIQGWDFKSLYDKYKISIQIGGSDQWGNITTGLELIRKTIGEDAIAVGVTTNLLVKSTGEKFGKSSGHAIWLDRDMTRPFELYQYLLNIPDEDVEKFLLWLTSISISEINLIMDKHYLEPSKRIGQKKLAYRVVADIHSVVDADEVTMLSEVMFGSIPIQNLTAQQVLQLEGSIPTIVHSGGNIQQLLIIAKVASSKREAREFILSGAIQVNGETIRDPEFEIKPLKFQGKATIMRRGKKKYFLIKH